MIEKQFRVGNIVDLHIEGADTWINARELSINDIECISSGASFAPIPLSEEWLIRAGFKQDKTKNYYTKYLKEYDSVLTLNWNEKSGEVHSIGIVHPNIDTTLTNFCWHFKHVHRLQNIFHSLTGEELNFKL